MFFAKPSNKITKVIKISLEKQKLLFLPFKNDKIDSYKITLVGTRINSFNHITRKINPCPSFTKKYQVIHEVLTY
jgi:hypothetical protein